MKLRWRGILAGALATVGLLSACNAIVGVEDVRLRVRDAGREAAPVEETDGDTPTRPNVVLATLGDRFSCARLTDGTARCWGQGNQGQLGAGAGDGGVDSVPRAVGNVSDAIEIGAGQNHACAVRASGGVQCWGYNLDGQLGNGEAGNVRNTPVEVTGITNAVTIAAGGNFSCVVRRTGSVACWGGNGSGQLGNGTQNGTSTPASVSNLTGVVSIAAGDSHACAAKSDGTVVCWGDGSNGQLGNGATGSTLTPVAVASLSDAVQVTAGERSSCALRRTGNVACWGANELGQLGSGAGNNLPNPSPILVANLDDAVNVVSGQNHTCAARRSGKVACWGSGANGDLGAATDAGFRPSFVEVVGVENAASAAAGGAHSCATTTDNGIVCWGANDVGQLGNGMTTDSPSPVAVTGIP